MSLEQPSFQLLSDPDSANETITGFQLDPKKISQDAMVEYLYYAHTGDREVSFLHGNETVILRSQNELAKEKHPTAKRLSAQAMASMIDNGKGYIEAIYVRQLGPKK